MILAIDFDGVVHDFRHPVPGRRMGPPKEGCKEALEKLKSQGHEIIIHTVWGDEKGQAVISKFMEYYQLPFDSITNIKPNADYYIDDKAVLFTEWKDLVLFNK